MHAGRSLEEEDAEFTDSEIKSATNNQNAISLLLIGC